MKKFLPSILVIVVVVIVGIMIVKNSVAKALVTTGVKAITGLTLKIDKLDVGIFNSAIGIKGLKLHNPKGFDDPVMVNIPEIYVDYNLGAIIGGKIHLEEVRLHLEEFMVVRNTDGALNLDALKAVQASKEDETQEEQKETKEKSKMPEIQIDALSLKIGQVVYKDYTKGSEPKVQKFVVNINENYKDVTNPYMLTSIIVSRALMNTSIARLTGFDVGALQGQIGNQLGKAKELATQSVSKATDAAKDVAGEATKMSQEALGTATNTIEGATKSIKSLIPFGDKE